MAKTHTEIDGYFHEMAMYCLSTRNQRITGYWQPKASQALSGAAPECLAVMREILPGYFEKGAAMAPCHTMQDWLVAPRRIPIRRRRLVTS